MAPVLGIQLARYIKFLTLPIPQKIFWFLWEEMIVSDQRICADFDRSDWEEFDTPQVKISPTNLFV